MKEILNRKRKRDAAMVDDKSHRKLMFRMLRKNVLLYIETINSVSKIKFTAFAFLLFNFLNACENII